MFSRTQEPSLLDLATDRAIRELRNHPIDSQDYARILDSIVKLHKMKEDEKPSSLSKDTLAIIAANLLGILMIIKHEHVNVITSRAMNLVMKPR